MRPRGLTVWAAACSRVRVRRPRPPGERSDRRIDRIAAEEKRPSDGHDDATTPSASLHSRPPLSSRRRCGGGGNDAAAACPVALLERRGREALLVGLEHTHIRENNIFRNDAARSAGTCRPHLCFKKREEGLLSGVRRGTKTDHTTSYQHIYLYINIYQYIYLSLPLSLSLSLSLDYQLPISKYTNIPIYQYITIYIYIYLYIYL